MTTHEVIRRIVTDQMKQYQATVTPILSEAELLHFESVASFPSSEVRLSKQAEQRTLQELRRLQHEVMVRDQMIRDLKTQLVDTQDELHHELTVLTPHQHALPSWLNEEPRDDNGEYARGVRV